MSAGVREEAADVDDPWFINLIVCTVGSFTTIVAMTLLLPFLPLYVEEIGVRGHAAIVQWSGVAYGATFFTAALTAPLWGRLGDRYGRKLMLIRASLGMAIAMSLTGMAAERRAACRDPAPDRTARRLRLRLDDPGRGADAEGQVGLGARAPLLRESWRATSSAR